MSMSESGTQAGIYVRIGTQDDAEQISALFREAYPDTHGSSHKCRDSAFVRDSLQRDMWHVIFDGKNLMAQTGDQSIELTRKEMDIIIFLHRHNDRIVSKKELLTDVWHYADADIETRTVDIHLLKLRKKIAALIGNTPLISTIRGEGYRLETG